MIEVTCALLVDKNRILITQNGETSDHPYQWEFPGGKIKTNETAEECVTREIKEELELEIEVLGALTPIVHDYGFKKIKLVPFVCALTGGSITLNAHIDKKWVDYNDFESIDFSEADKRMVCLPENRVSIEKYTRE